MKKISILLIFTVIFMQSCNENREKKNVQKPGVTFAILNPGHFHAALVQKEMYECVDTNVFVYAPEGEELNQYLSKIESYNSRAKNPTNWNVILYKGEDYLKKMIEENKGNVAVLAGNNQQKTAYIHALTKAGFNILSDKPMAIDTKGFDLLQSTFKLAEEKDLLLYDIMTERYEITTMLQKEFSQIPEIFGDLIEGTPENPAITKESVHHYYKFVSGSVLQRPTWFFDVKQQGNAIVDVGTHLFDLVQWECFPEQIIDYQNDIEIINAKCLTVPVAKEQFLKVTGKKQIPSFLSQLVKNDTLYIDANGEVTYKLKNVYAKVSVLWKYAAPQGGGDTHYSIMRGTKANLIIRQGANQNYKPVLYIEAADKQNTDAFNETLKSNMQKIEEKYPGIQLSKEQDNWKVHIPEKYKIGHEAHFSQVTQKYLRFLNEKNMPEWEIPNMIAKYYTSTKALQIALKNKNK